MEQASLPDARQSTNVSRGTAPVAASPPRKWPVVALLVVIAMLLLAVAAVLMNSDGPQTAKTGGPGREDSSGSHRTTSPTAAKPESRTSPPTSTDLSEPRPDADPGKLHGITVLASTLDQWRQKATMPMREDVADGWTKSRVDPAKVVEAFELLKLKKGYVLRAYQFREDVNGNGIVWAMPETADFPEPKDCPILATHPFKAPKPAAALDDVMEVIAGDGTPLSYMAASILRRQFSELGAAGHGCKWSMHAVLENDPWNAASAKGAQPPLDISPGDRNLWKWQEAEPKYWPPKVSVQKDQVNVTFYTYTNLEKQRIFRHTDIYRPGDYRAKSEDKPIAEGPPGFMP